MADSSQLCIHLGRDFKSHPRWLYQVDTALARIFTYLGPPDVAGMDNVNALKSKAFQTDANALHISTKVVSVKASNIWSIVEKLL